MSSLRRAVVVRAPRYSRVLWFPFERVIETFRVCARVREREGRRWECGIIRERVGLFGCFLDCFVLGFLERTVRKGL